MDRDAFVAIADPTRREIIELLNDKELLTAGDIAEEFAHVTRPAISRQLRILRECDVVHVFRNGKHQLYALNPKPLQLIRDNWLQNFSAKHVRSLKALRRLAESPPQ